ncbi:MAG: hypothetical protein HY423_10320 [Candidatus Lambdaproteobacteria bacterium]|nr:hypothetical protein [Candidatus Lambdaproteobacteria bacterium]
MFQQVLGARGWKGSGCGDAQGGAVASNVFCFPVTFAGGVGNRIHDAFAAYGYSRDKKRGKQQIVVGLPADPVAEPAQGGATGP